METRYNYIWMWLGTNKVGKTPIATLMAVAYKRSRPDHEIYCHDNRHSIRKVKYINSKGREELLIKKENLIHQWDTEWADKLLGVENIYDEDKKKFVRKQVKPPKRNYLLLLDDYQLLCPNYKTPQGLRDLLAMVTEYNIEIIMITHSPKFILEGVAEQVTDYSIFYNNARSLSFDSKILNSDKCKEGSLIVNEYVTKFGYGTYPKFPYAHINKTGQMDLVNMEESKLRQLSCLKFKHK